VVDERFQLTPESSERDLLTTFLEFQRAALVRKCHGLTDEQARSRPVASSSVTLVGLVRHLATVERWYFQGVLADAFPGSLFDHESDEAFNAVDDATVDRSFATWAGEVEASRAITDRLDLDAVGVMPSGERLTLRWVLLHMIDEYARHLGHADILREAIDGTTGE
jgi:hypothetical protein